MRRLGVGALLFLFLGRSSGVALAGTAGSSAPMDLAAVISPVQATIRSSRLYAALTGTTGQYDAIHATVPVIRPPETSVDAARLLQSQYALKPQIRQGVRAVVTMPDRSALDPRHRRVDPLAMRPSNDTLGTPRPSPTPPVANVPVLQPLRVLTTSAGSQALNPRQGSGINQTTFSSAGAGAGIEHWWTYEERAIPGIGKAMVNVGTGNLVVSAADVDVSEQGIDLAFQRVYNSQSLHDAQGDDGGDPSIFGNRWTNNFDASIVYNSTANTITVYDLDGTPCTYTSSGNGAWVPCTGEYATLAPTDSSDCTYAWTKPKGTIYWFHTDGGTTGFGCSGLTQAKRGRLQEILARNQKNYITFSYSYDGTGTTSEDITEILVTHSDGHTLVMQFGLIPGTTINELATITKPDNVSTLQYLYDNMGDLVEVDKPGNNSAFPAPSPPNNHPSIPGGDVPETYGYIGMGTMQEACGPRCTTSMWPNGNTITDGTALLFSINATSLQLSNWQVQGVLNFTPSDGTSTPLQSGPPTGSQTWYTASFDYGVGTDCTGTSGGTTTMCDSDGHGTIWTVDGSSRVTQTLESTASVNGIMIPTSQVWDTNNNLVSTTDANGNVTKYAYDSPGTTFGGNMVEMQLPNLTDITPGATKPLSYYSYDSNNNVKAYCDPVYNQTNGNGWVAPADNLCPSAAGAAYFNFNTSDANEPFGCLISMHKPGGYITSISYPGGTTSCGSGLPTQVQGTTITQYDNSTRQPTQDLGYDTYGNLTAYDKGSPNGGTLQGSWTLAYDNDNSLVQTTENDSQIPLSGSAFTCHYPDGSALYSETPSQHHADQAGGCPSMSTLLSGPYNPPANATAYYYDMDGDQVKMITHKGCTLTISCGSPISKTACTGQEQNPIGATCKYYDGLDRLVETTEPYDNRQFADGSSYEFYTFRWMNRYLYDLSENAGAANLTISDSTGTTHAFAAYGNLYKTQEYLPQPTNMIGRLSDNGYSSGQWNDVRGTSFDGLNRPLNKYELAYGTAAVTKNTYDSSGQLGLLSSATNAVSQTTSYAYDGIGKVEGVTFSGTAPLADPRSYTFDADGRTTSVANTMGTLSYTYDLDGNKLTTLEPNSQAQNVASLICYYYYPDGLREWLSIGPANAGTCGNIQHNMSPGNGGISQPHIFSYLYRNDGLLLTQTVNWGSTQTFSWTYYPSEREKTATDPLTGDWVYYPEGLNPRVQLSAKSYLYDSFGRVAQLTLPEGYEESSFVYDFDDQLASYNESQGATQGATRYFVDNARGEQLEDTPALNAQPGASWAQGPTHSANGTQVGNGSGGAGQVIQAPPTTEQFDVRSNMVTCSVNPGWAQGIQNWYVYRYDPAGRQVASGTDANANECNSTYANMTINYDAENHIQSFGNSASPISWGPDVRQRVDIVTDQFGHQVTETAHWDGDTLLFATGDGLSPYLYIRKAGVMDPSGDIFITDRDQTGAQVTTHAQTPAAPPQGVTQNDNWFAAWTTGSVRPIYVYKSGQHLDVALFPGTCPITDTHGTTFPCPTFGPTFPMKRSDGYSMIGGIVQGARTYDPISGQWLTPDAYAGDVRDPMSQKPFMWNNNNPVAWNDPSGYLPEDEEELETARPGPNYQMQEYNNARTQIDKEYPGGESRAVRISRNAESHMFRNSAGHVDNSPTNRALIENTANNPANLRGPDSEGNDWYSMQLKSGAQAWAEVRNGKITNGGINPANANRDYNPVTGLNKPAKTQQEDQQRP